jgi:hypothetical protein
MPSFTPSSIGNMDAFIVGQPESGYAVVKDWMRFPAGFTLIDQTFDISTGATFIIMWLNQLLRILQRGYFH